MRSKLEARAEMIHRYFVESVEQAAEHSIADIEQCTERDHFEKVASVDGMI